MSIPASRTVADSTVTLARIMTEADTNLHGNVHGGVIMKFVDDVAGAVAARHAGGKAVTVSMDEMVFLLPVHVGDLVRVISSINWAGRTSMEIGVRVETERWDEAGGLVTHTNSAYLVYVGVDDSFRPVEIPQLEIMSPTEQRRFNDAEIRRRHRLARRDELLATRTKKQQEGTA